MLDHRVVASVENAQLVLGTPVKAPENPLIQADQPWENALNNLYPNVRYDGGEGLFKLWYKCVLSDKDVIAKMDGPRTVHDVGWYLLYAISKDGLRWEKPKLGLHKFDGDAANNIVARDCPNVGVFKDDHDPDPARRYKMTSDVGLGKPQVRFSADGVHWGPATPVEGFGAKEGDTHNNAFWDERSKKYLWFTKFYPGERTVARLESDDFIHWKNNGMVLRSTPQEGKADQTYALTVFPYANGYLGYVMMYHLGKGKTVDCELAWSPDALHWERVMPGTPFLPRGAKGAYDSECIYAMAGPPVVQERSLLIFYGGSATPHVGWKRHCLPCLARLPQDHFAGYRPKGQGKVAVVVTEPVTAAGTALFLTADTAGGGIRVVAIGEDGKTLGESEIISRPEPFSLVRWKEGSKPEFSGQKIRLRLELTNATLWAIHGCKLLNSEWKPPVAAVSKTDP
jgi:hypothetical protein